MKSKIVSIVGVLMIGLILVGCGNSVVKKSIEQAKTAIESKEYDKALASLQLALDEDKDNEEANKLYSIVDGYQKAKKLVDEKKVTEAKEVIDGISNDYINYVIKDDIDNLKSQIDNYLKEVENITTVLNKILGSPGESIEPNKYTTEEQKAKAEDLVNRSEQALIEIDKQKEAEKAKIEEEKRKAEEEARKKEELNKFTGEKAISILKSKYGVEHDDIAYYVGTTVEYENGQAYYLVSLKSKSMMANGGSGTLGIYKVFEDGRIE